MVDWLGREEMFKSVKSSSFVLLSLFSCVSELKPGANPACADPTSKDWPEASSLGQVWPGSGSVSV